MNGKMALITITLPLYYTSKPKTLAKFIIEEREAGRERERPSSHAATVHGQKRVVDREKRGLLPCRAQEWLMVEAVCPARRSQGLN